MHSSALLECGDAAWELSLALKVTAMYRMIRAFPPAMLDQSSGNIITDESGYTTGTPHTIDGGWLN